MNGIKVRIRQIFWVGSFALSAVLVAPFYADAAETPREKIAIAYAAIIGGVLLAGLMAARRRKKAA